MSIRLAQTLFRKSVQRRHAVGIRRHLRLGQNLQLNHRYSNNKSLKFISSNYSNKDFQKSMYFNDFTGFGHFQFFFSYISLGFFFFTSKKA